ncbi:Ldo16p NDAI_0H03050 [Naumovozyma dairenensis CBS 421]|uniref:Outer spore wall protein 5 n=1 Tax=Naumovozyma dairenensis (strain ATCC 10597 / BCRC 20456 / CBS 421 / NBRC 0211 / NRRL Y-12639) TaxID=1071378 RepID=G0WFB7_NAUDC|nr:hypothetical protein NDAI_0H03050 [Naumovozyma dairenensis CBS 421]CCD26478.1 hypothetical protein NDAI_0H03050 [Naumovozyma dairenensis CBS 421]
MVSLASVYFFIYLVIFLIIATASSIFIIPLLGTSFIFAVGVVTFGFISNVTFKLAQNLYFSADERLKSTLKKMSKHTSSHNSKTKDKDKYGPKTPSQGINHCEHNIFNKNLDSSTAGCNLTFVRRDRNWLNNHSDRNDNDETIEEQEQEDLYDTHRDEGPTTSLIARYLEPEPTSTRNKKQQRVTPNRRDFEF